jgi:hypothetical protein
LAESGQGRQQKKAYFKRFEKSTGGMQARGTVDEMYGVKYNKSMTRCFVKCLTSQLRQRASVL